jgi:hypothetical protein
MAKEYQAKAMKLAGTEGVDIGAPRPSLQD